MWPQAFRIRRPRRGLGVWGAVRRGVLERELVGDTLFRSSGRGGAGAQKQSPASPERLLGTPQETCISQQPACKATGYVSRDCRASVFVFPWFFCCDFLGAVLRRVLRRVLQAFAHYRLTMSCAILILLSFIVLSLTTDNSSDSI